MPSLQWFSMGAKMFQAMLQAIASARHSIRLETYIYTDGAVGQEFLMALVAAQRRGVRVRVLVDALGSWPLPGNFFAPLFWAGGEARFFNPLRFWRLGVRDHRKLLVCDEEVLFVGGFNVADEYNGDGVTKGWRDVGVRLENPQLAQSLAATFDELFELADFKRKPLMCLRAFTPRRRKSSTPDEQILLSHPGLGPSPLQHALRHDLRRARDVRIISAYFLPTWRIRRDLMRVVRRGGRVQLILPSKSDVLISQLASRHLVSRLLRAGVEIYEYQPQILHAKLMVLDGVTYVGSANLDIRSLKLNYELMLRLAEESVTAVARQQFDAYLPLCRRIEQPFWRKSRGHLQRLQSAWAYFLLARVDRWLALKQFRAVAD